MAGQPDRDNEHETRRILDRIARESAPHPTRLEFPRVPEEDENDPIERWGTLIGRGLGLVLTIAMLIAVGYYLHNS